MKKIKTFLGDILPQHAINVLLSVYGLMWLTLVVFIIVSYFGHYLVIAEGDSGMAWACIVLSLPVILVCISLIISTITDGNTSGLKKLRDSAIMTVIALFIFAGFYYVAERGLCGMAYALPGVKHVHTAYLTRIEPPRSVRVGRHHRTVSTVTAVTEQGDSLTFDVDEDSFDRLKADPRVTVTQKSGILGTKFLHVEGLHLR